MADGDGDWGGGDVVTTRVYRRWHGFVRRALAQHRVADRDVDDLTQEVFILLLRRIRERRTEHVTRGWLYQTARRIAANHRRGETRRHRREAHAHTDPASGERPGLDEWLHRRDAERRLGSFLAGLDDDAAAALVMFDIEGRSGHEVAQALGVERSVAYARARLARNKLEAACSEFRESEETRARSWWVFPAFLRPVGLTVAIVALLAVGRAADPSTPRELEMPSAAEPPPSSRPVMALAQAHPPTAAPTTREGDPLRVRGARRAAPPARPTPTPSAPPPDQLHDLRRDLGKRPTTTTPPRLPKRASTPEPAPSRSPGFQAIAVDEHGTPVAGALIRCRRIVRGLRKRCYDRGVTPKTDARGRFALHLRPGRYDVLPFPKGAMGAAGDGWSLEVHSDGSVTVLSEPSAPHG